MKCASGMRWATHESIPALERQDRPRGLKRHGTLSRDNASECGKTATLLSMV